MPVGYRPATRVFTKISEIPVSHLRSVGHSSEFMLTVHISKEMHMNLV